MQAAIQQGVGALTLFSSNDVPEASIKILY
jgi:hypothetical protein